MFRRIGVKRAIFQPRWVAIFLLLTVLIWVGSNSINQINPKVFAQGPNDLAGLAAKAQSQGIVRVIVELDVPGYQPEGELADSRAVSAQQVAITKAQDALLQAVAGQNATLVRRFEFIPYLALEVDATSLNTLAQQVNVTRITEDVAVPPTLADSVSLMRTHFAHGLFYKGNGQTVAILDTGVDKNHPALAGKVVSEACYSTTSAAQNSSSMCPGGVSSSTASNAGLHCSTTISGCDHGTHVAGIAAGVAPEARLIAVQVFSRMDDSATNTPCANANRTSPCTLAFSSDIISALERVYALRNSFNIASVNMSLGGGGFTTACDTDPRKAIIDTLRSADISTVIAAGNSSFLNAMGSPACISTSISVGATTKQDQIASFSNLSSGTTLLAPGVNIFAPIPGNQYDDKNGTSMAAPHVAGAIAILKQAKTNATVNEITAALTSPFNPIVPDQRTNGLVDNKRRLDVYNALCALISCDADDYRTIFTNQTLTGTIGQASDRDHYYFNAVAGNRITLQLNRSSGSMNPYLELYSPTGVFVALNNNGGTGTNALINNYILQQTGRYLIVARSTSGTGAYQLIASANAVQLNPVPAITTLSPRSATATFVGGDFWMRVYGRNFTPESQVYWNGSYRSTVYSSSTRLWARIRGSDIRFPAPRTAFVTVRNPAPGGGTSNPYPFSITFPFLGESELIAPEAPASTQVGIKTTFAISWTHPMSSWHVMQNMDLRLRNEHNETAAWIRLVEGQNMTATYRLLNASETSRELTNTVIYEGVPGENLDLVMTDTVTLHLAESPIKGTGQTVIMSPTVTFGPAAVGTYNIEFRVDNDDGSIQDDDVLGTFTILPAGCSEALTEITLGGPTSGTVNTDYGYTASISPTTATTPITYTWSPDPKTGQGTSNAVYNWPYAGEETVTVVAENCGGFVAEGHPVAVSTQPMPDLAIRKQGPVVAAEGEQITYTLTITNRGAMTASNVMVTDTLPSNASYVSGGTLNGNVVSWTIPELAGNGTISQTMFVVTASSAITNSDYGVTATGGYQASGMDLVATQIVSAKTTHQPTVTKTLSYAGKTDIVIPAGAVFDHTELAYTHLVSPTHSLPENGLFLGTAFHLTAYQAQQPLENFTFAEAYSITLMSVSDTTGSLYYWNGTAWSQDGISCRSGTAADEVVCMVQPEVALAEFAFFKIETTSQPPEIYLPMILKTIGSQIISITLNGSTYQVNFKTIGFTPALPGTHLHFFFNTVPASQAGAPGSGPWKVYGGGSPFTGYSTSERPAGATQMCVLVANPDHSVQAETGNCYPLPN